MQRESSAPTLAVVLGIAATVSGCGPRVEDNGAGSADGTSTGSADTTVSPSGTSVTDTASPVTTAMPSTTIDPSTSSVDTGDFTTDAPGSAGFLYGAPDGGGTPQECSTWDQDCADGDKCMPWANDGGDVLNATKCSPIVPDPAGAGEPCRYEGSPFSGVENCDLGSICWFADETTNEGTCVPMCEGMQPQVCPSLDTSCVDLDGLFGVCLLTCDASNPMCPDDLECTAGPNGASHCQ